MDLKLTNRNENNIQCDALVLPVFKDENRYGNLTSSVVNEIESLLKKKFFRAKHLDTYLLHIVSDISPKRVLLIGLGKRQDSTSEKLRQAGGTVASTAQKYGLRNLAISTDNISQSNPSPFIEGLLLGAYRYKRYKTLEEDNDEGGYPDRIQIIQTEGVKKEEIEDIKTITSAVHFARDLVNTPSNDLTPSDLVNVAKTLKDRKTKLTVLDRKEATKEGLGAFLAVSRGSKEEPKFIVIEYKGGKKPTIVLIGKSITFDSGGISLKPSEGMEKMKYDMAGGAAVLGVIKYAIETKLPVCIIGILPATENLPGGSATKPGDVVKSITGKTIEIINTDAEGRLALADAIGYAKRFAPDVIIDIATLTGACSIALGGEAMALMGNNEKIINSLKESSEHSGEKVWQMPLYEEYREYLKSDIADIKNTGGRSGSLVTAGYFLKEFAEDAPWAHLDIASTAWTDRDRPYSPKGATGVGVRLLIQFLKEYMK